MQRFLNPYTKSYYGGGLMILIGVGAAIQGSSYHIGTLSRMGAGFFPVALGVLLVCIGLAIALTAQLEVGAPASAALAPEWRGWLCITLSIVAFIVLGRYGGLLPATFAIVFISAMGDRQNTLKSALMLSLAMVAVCTIIFSWALKMQFPLFRWG